MTTDDNVSNQKRQEVLQRLRERRGETRHQTQSQSDSTSNDPPIRAMKRQNLRPGGMDMSQLKQELAQNPELLQTFLERRQRKRMATDKATPENTTTESGTISGQDKTQLGAFLEQRKRKMGNKRTMPPGLVQDVQQILSGVETNLTSTPPEELKQRSQNLKYRCDWLHGLIEEMQKEVQRIEDYLQTQEST